MRLLCVSRYRSATRSVDVGQILDELTDAEARRLLADAPGCWQDADALPFEEPQATAFDAPPADKMIRRGVRK